MHKPLHIAQPALVWDQPTRAEQSVRDRNRARAAAAKAEREAACRVALTTLDVAVLAAVCASVGALLAVVL